VQGQHDAVLLPHRGAGGEGPGRRAGEAGDLLVRARDAELKAAIAQQKLVASSTLDIQGRQAQLDLAQFRFDRLKSTRNYSPWSSKKPASL